MAGHSPTAGSCTRRHWAGATWRVRALAAAIAAALVAGGIGLTTLGQAGELAASPAAERDLPPSAILPAPAATPSAPHALDAADLALPDDPPPAPVLEPLAQWAVKYRTFDTRATHETFSGTAVGDIDGDGAPEVVAGAPDGRVRAWALDGTLTLEHRVGNGAVHATPALVDLDGDGVLDVLSASLSGDVTGVRGDGTRVFHVTDKGPVSPLRGVFPTPAVGDLDGDGSLEVVVTSWDHYVHAFRLDGRELPGFPVFVYDTIWSSPTLADLDGDGRNEIVFGGDMDEYPGAPFPKGGLLWALRADGSRVPGFPRSLPGQVIWSSPAVVDLTGDGALDIVVGTGLNWPDPAGRAVYALDRTGRDLPGWPVAVSGRVMASPAIGDVDGDGALDVATLSDDGFLTVHRRDGSTAWTVCALAVRPGCRNGAGVHSQAAIADVDADGVQEVISAAGEHVRVFDGLTGFVEAEDAMPAVWSPPAAPTVAEVDGRTVVAVNTSRKARGDGRPGPGDEQVVWLWTTSAPLGRADWPTFKQNHRRSGTWGDDRPPVSRFEATPPAVSRRADARLRWSAHDPTALASGIAHFDLQVSVDGGPWQPWLSGTRRTDATLALTEGAVTAVRVRAVDRAGNVGRWSAAASVRVLEGATRTTPFAAAYAVSRDGELSAVSSPPVAGPRWPAPLGRDVAVAPGGRGGWVLDGYGGLTPFGGAPALGTSAYWRGWDIARAVALHRDGRSGYVLDGLGGLHPVGAAAPVRSTARLAAADLAVDVALLPSSSASEPAGYVLDAWGGLHAFGSAPPARGSGWWPGRRLAAAIALDPGGGGGWVLDAYGGLHPFGGARAVRGGPYWPGRPLARDVAAVGSTSGYVLDAHGGVHPYGGAPPVEPARWWGRDAAVAMGIARSP